MTKAPAKAFLDDLTADALPKIMSGDAPKSREACIKDALDRGDVAELGRIIAEHGLHGLRKSLGERLLLFCFRGGHADLAQQVLGGGRGGLELRGGSLSNQLINDPSSKAVPMLLAYFPRLKSDIFETPEKMCSILSTSLFERAVAEAADGTLTEAGAASIAETLSALSAHCGRRPHQTYPWVKAMSGLLTRNSGGEVFHIDSAVMRPVVIAMLSNNGFGMNTWTAMWSDALENAASYRSENQAIRDVALLGALNDVLSKTGKCADAWLSANRAAGLRTAWLADSKHTLPLDGQGGNVRKMLMGMGFVAGDGLRHSKRRVAIAGDYLSILLATGATAITAVFETPEGRAAVMDRLQRPSVLLDMIRRASPAFSVRMIKACKLTEWKDGYDNGIGHYLAAGLALRNSDDVAAINRGGSLITLASAHWLERNQGGYSAGDILALSGINIPAEVHAKIDAAVIARAPRKSAAKPPTPKM